MSDHDENEILITPQEQAEDAAMVRLEAAARLAALDPDSRRYLERLAQTVAAINNGTLHPDHPDRIALQLGACARVHRVAAGAVRPARRRGHVMSVFGGTHLDDAHLHCGRCRKYFETATLRQLLALKLRRTPRCWCGTPMTLHSDDDLYPDGRDQACECAGHAHEHADAEVPW